MTILRNYVVATRFGELVVERENIKLARAWAKSAHGVGPECVTPQREYVPCDRCDCAPCCCQGGK